MQENLLSCSKSKKWGQTEIAHPNFIPGGGNLMANISQQHPGKEEKDGGGGEGGLDGVLLRRKWCRVRQGEKLGIFTFIMLIAQNRSKKIELGYVLSSLMSYPVNQSKGTCNFGWPT